MTFVLTYAWWWIPSAATVIFLIWSMIPTSEDAEIVAAKMFFSVLSLAVLWAVAGFLK